jgi:PilZ domain
MGKSVGRSRFHSVIDSKLLQSFKILAAKQDKRLNRFLEEAIQDILNKYREQCVGKATPLVIPRERREYARIETSLPAKMFTSQGIIHGIIKNISKSGALINCSELPETDNKFRLQIDLMNHCLTPAIVVEKIRLNLDESDSSLFSYDLAVRFIDTDDRTIAALLNKMRGKLSIKPETRSEGPPNLLQEQSL